MFGCQIRALAEEIILPKFPSPDLCRYRKSGFGGFHLDGNAVLVHKGLSPGR